MKNSQSSKRLEDWPENQSLRLPFERKIPSTHDDASLPATALIDVLDIFPAESAETALRISLFDDEVESMMLFDPLTGRTLKKVARYTVYGNLTKNGLRSLV